MNPLSHPKASAIATGTFIVIMMTLALLHRAFDWKLAMFIGMAIGTLLQKLIDLILKFLPVVLVAAFLTPDANAQEAPQNVPAYNWNTAALQVSMPEYPGQERSPIIVGAVCVGVVVGIVGYIGVRIISACVKNVEHIITNNADCGPCPQESPIPPSQVPKVTGPPAPTSDCACDAPPAADQPLPLRVQHSFDQVNWATVAEGIAIGSEFLMPDEGYWRVVPMFITTSIEDGILVIHAPPGVVEFSPDMEFWEELTTNRQATDIIGCPGFFRVRLN